MIILIINSEKKALKWIFTLEFIMFRYISNIKFNMT